MGATQQVVLVTSVIAAAALVQQRFVGADNAPCQAGAAALGVAEVDAAVGDVVPVNVLGIVVVEAGDAVARGGNVQSDASGCAITLAEGGMSCGIALDEALAAGDAIRILRGV